MTQVPVYIPHIMYHNLWCWKYEYPLFNLGFEELASYTRRIRHATDASSVTGGSSTNDHPVHDAHDEPNGYEPTLDIPSGPILQPKNIPWFRSEILRLRFGEYKLVKLSLS